MGKTVIYSDKNIIVQTILSFSLLLFSGANFCVAAEKVTVLLHTIQLSGKYRAVLADLVDEFNLENTQITLEYIVENNEIYHEKRKTCLQDPHCPVDIYLGFAGYNFVQNVAHKKIEAIDDIWQQEALDLYFSRVKKSISFEGKQYGLPISYYPWGFFYNKSIFKNLKLTPPKTWSEFLTICERVKAANLVPILIGTKTPFPAASWFSYLNLRLHGLKFHMQLTSGRAAYTDKKVRQTFEFWKNLIDQNYFNDNHNQLTYSDALPYLYRGLGSMYLMGNIVLSKIPEKIKSDIGYFRFPTINPSIPLYEEVPLDIFFIPKQSKHKKAAKKVLTFFSRPDISYRYNEAAGYLSPNEQSKKSNDKLVRITSEHLKSTAGFSYFFNRNSPPEMGRPGTKLLGHFMSTRNIKLTIQKFEALREKVVSIEE